MTHFCKSSWFFACIFQEISCSTHNSSTHPTKFESFVLRKFPVYAFFLCNHPKNPSRIWIWTIRNSKTKEMIHVINIFYCNDSSFVLKCSIRNKFCILVVVSNILLFSPRNLGKMNPFWRIFFRWVGSTTNQIYIISRFLCRWTAFSFPGSHTDSCHDSRHRIWIWEADQGRMFVGKTMYTLGMGLINPKKTHIYTWKIMWVLEFGLFKVS